MPLSYMFSNWSTRRLVLPLRISRSVLYLSRPCLTFSLCNLSIAVSFVSSLSPAKSFFNIYRERATKKFRLAFSQRTSVAAEQQTLSWFWSRSFFSARVSRSSTGSRIVLAKSLSETKSLPPLTSPFGVSSSSPSS